MEILNGFLHLCRAWILSEGDVDSNCVLKNVKNNNSKNKTFFYMQNINNNNWVTDVISGFLSVKFSYFFNLHFKSKRWMSENVIVDTSKDLWHLICDLRYFYNIRMVNCDFTCFWDQYCLDNRRYETDYSSDN